jgi:type II secretory pathway component PulK
MNRCSNHTRAGRFRATGTGRRGGGTVLIVTMWILLVLAGLVLVVARSMRATADCAANESAAVQAAAIEQGAIQYVLASVDGLQGQVPVDADVPCEAVQVGNGAFWILRPAGEDQTTYAFGITDEASKVNLNTASLDMLSRLPGMTTELAASIVDWRDTDSDVTSGGAESEYYLMLADPYECKNGPLETVEELFLIRDATPEMLYGRDANRNGIIDPGESDSPFSGSFTSSGTRLDRGIIPFVTVYSGSAAAASSGTTSGGTASSGTASSGTASGSTASSGTASSGTASGSTALINVNDSRSQALTTLLRTNVSSDRLPGVLDRVRRERPFRNLMDFYYRAGLTMDEFQKIAGQITTTSGQSPKGLINVTTAPKEVLLCLPGLEESDVAALLARRPTTEPERSNLAWVTEALSREKAIGIGGAITAQSYVFSADILSIAANGRAFRRCRVVVDASSSPPKVIYRQDLTRLGWPLSQDIVASLRSGTPLEQVVQAASRRIGQL